MSGLPIRNVRTVVTTGVPARDEQGRLVLYLHPDTLRELERLRGAKRRRRRPLPGVGDAR